MEEKRKFFNTKTIAGLGILTSLVIILQIIANYIQLGPVSITLSLIPVVLGALIYGPIGGAFLGLVDGAITLFAPSTIAVFWNYSPVATLVTCLLKLTLAGAITGLVFIPLKKNHTKLGVIICSLLCPIINTGLFVVGVFIFFYGLALQYAGAQSVVGYVFLTMIGWNFILEFALNAVLSIGLYHIYLHFKTRQSLSN